MGRLSATAIDILPALDLLEWCDNENRKPITRRMGRWYHVREVDGQRFADCLEGIDGVNVHRLLAGKLEDFAGWPAARMGGYRAWLRTLVEAGLVAA